MDITTTLSDLKHRIRARIPLSVQEQLSIRRRKRRVNAQINADPDILLVEVGNDRYTEGREWFRGDHVHYMPSRTNLFEKNAIQEYVLKGWLPNTPFISKDHYITAFGSCFAVNVSNYLLKHGYRVFNESSAAAAAYVIRCGEGMVNTFAVVQQFQWAYGEKEFNESLWFDKAGVETPYRAEIRQRTRAVFEQTDIFIITLGLSEVWYNKQTGDVFWRAIPRSQFDPLRHGFKITSVGENLENLNTIYRIIRERRPNASIIFTLSPIPLLATFRPVSCITANSVSKSILRVAVDEFHRAHSQDKQLFYFPSFEMVKEYFRDPFRGDNRHVRGKIVNEIMDNFAKHYLLR